MYQRFSIGLLVSSMLIGLTSTLYIKESNAEESKNTNLPALVPPNALGYVRVQLDQVWADPEAKTVLTKFVQETPDIREDLGFHPIEIRNVLIVFLPPTPAMIEPPAVLIYRHSVPFDRELIRKTLWPQAQKTTYRGREHYLWEQPRDSGTLFEFLDDHTMLVGFLGPYRQWVDGLLDKGRENKIAPMLEKARANHFLTAGLLVPENLSGALQIEFLPPELQMFKPLIHLKSATATIDLGDKIEINAELTFPDEAKAKEGLAVARTGLALAQFGLGAFTAEIARADLEVIPQLLKAAGHGLMRAESKQEGNQVVIAARVEASTAKCAKAFGEFASATAINRRTQDAQNMQTLAKFMHMYANDYLGFPAHAIYGKNEKPLLSWRVSALPYIEHGDLYRQFRLDEPWDSEHNKKLVEKMPEIFASPAAAGDPEHTTRYQVIRGKGALFGEKDMPGPGVLTNQDGTSGTILLTESAKPVPWTKPEDIEYDPDKALPKLGGTIPGGFNVCFADGSVFFVKFGFDEKVFRALITWAGSEVVDREAVNPK